jgi:hypothetical protein
VHMNHSILLASFSLNCCVKKNAPKIGFYSIYRMLESYEKFKFM